MRNEGGRRAALLTTGYWLLTTDYWLSCEGAPEAERT